MTDTSRDRSNRVYAPASTLQQRIDAAIGHIDRARAHANDVVRAELVMAIDVLRGQA